MILTFANDRFEMRRCGYDERMVPKTAGFRWDRKAKLWWTDNLPKAARLIDHADVNCKALISKAEGKARDSQVLSRASTSNLDIPIPHGLEYLPYQRAGIEYARDRKVTLIADEMGLGKTIQALGLANLQQAKSILVICPASLKVNWLRESQKWLTEDTSMRGFRYQLMAGSKTPIERTANVVIINYEILKKHGAGLRARVWDLLIIDEAHYIKEGSKVQRGQQILGYRPRRKANTDAEKWAKQLAKACSPIPYKQALLLTGTPMVNRPVELWPLCQMADPKLFPRFWDYGQRYCGAHNNGYGWDFKGATHQEELQDKLRSSFMVRRLKAEVLEELPPKRRQVLEVPMNGAKAAVTAEQKAIADWAKRKSVLQQAIADAETAEDWDAHARHVMELQEGEKVHFTKMSALRKETAIATIPYMIEILESTSEKVVFFAHHREVIRQLAEHFAGQCVVVQGGQSATDRQASVDDFQNDPHARIFLGNIRAAGVGLTLTAASHVIFGEQDWGPGPMTQAEDRCHRIGQRSSVLVQHIVVEGSMGAMMAKMVVEKQEVLDAGLDADTTAGVAAIAAHEAAQIKAAEEMAERNRQTAANAEAEKAVRDREQQARNATAAAAKTGAASRHDRRLAHIQWEAAAMTPGRIAAIHEALRLLAGVCDGAFAQDGIGFNGMDQRFGHDLAARISLSPKQAAVAADMLKKYKRQIPDDLYREI